MQAVIVCVTKIAIIVPKRRNFAKEEILHFFCQNICIYEKKAVLLQKVY